MWKDLFQLSINTWKVIENVIKCLRGTISIKGIVLVATETVFVVSVKSKREKLKNWEPVSHRDYKSLSL